MKAFTRIERDPDRRGRASRPQGHRGRGRQVRARHREVEPVERHECLEVNRVEPQRLDVDGDRRSGRHRASDGAPVTAPRREVVCVDLDVLRGPCPPLGQCLVLERHGAAIEPEVVDGDVQPAARVTRAAHEIGQVEVRVGETHDAHGRPRDDEVADPQVAEEQRRQADTGVHSLDLGERCPSVALEETEAVDAYPAGEQAKIEGRDRGRALRHGLDPRDGDRAHDRGQPVQRHGDADQQHGEDHHHPSTRAHTKRLGSRDSFSVPPATGSTADAERHAPLPSLTGRGRVG